MLKLLVPLSVFLLLATSAFADGWIFKNGHFPQGKVSIFTLTQSQKDFLDLIRRCSHDNKETPFLFKLTLEQSLKLKHESGLSPSRFAVFESYRGDNGVDIEINVINRFSEDQFEVPHGLLTPDKEAQNWEENIIGWSANPLENVDLDTLKGSCPH